MIDENYNKSRSELLDEIRTINFSIIELAQYLDINPEDRKALCLHNEYANKLRMLTDNYQRIYGPLTIECPCNQWLWLDQPWPWEKGGSF